MESASGPIYEFSCGTDREIVDEFDAWLAQRIDAMLQQPGISGAELYKQEDDEAGNARRVVHFTFYTESDLEAFLTAAADEDDLAEPERFADRVTTAHRVLRHADIADGALRPQQQCLNCGAVLGGQYCGDCGQRASSRLISVWELLRDAFGDLFEFDSRLWRTLVPLIARPGQLTRDYLEGRRARFMPPFRTYLVLSIVFFLIAFFDPREELGLLFAPAPEPVAENSEAVQPTGENIVVGAPDETGNDESGEDDGQLNFSYTTDHDGPECDADNIDTSDWPLWLSSRLTEERIKATCDRIVADDGRAFGRKLLDNVPVALFILLPLMALVLKILYPLSKRYYVEHLLFVVHYHAFVFLILSVQVLFARLGAAAGIPETPLDLTGIVVSLYVPVYLYKAQRRVYGQSTFITALKFLFLMFAYFTGLLLIFGLVALFAAFSI